MHIKCTATTKHLAHSKVTASFLAVKQERLQARSFKNEIETPNELRVSLVYGVYTCQTQVQKSIKKRTLGLTSLSYNGLAQSLLPIQ
jgi:hypothetical protein